MAENAGRDTQHPFEVAIDDVDADPIEVSVRGELDLVSAPSLGEALDKALAKGPRSIVVRLADVSFMDSSGLRVLVRCSNDVHAAGGSFQILGMSAAVRRVLEVTGLIEQLSASRTGDEVGQG